MRLDLAGCDKLAIDPAVTCAGVSRGGAGHHAALVTGYDSDLRIAPAQHDHVDMLLEKGDVVAKAGLSGRAQARQSQRSQEQAGETSLHSDPLKKALDFAEIVS